MDNSTIRASVVCCYNDAEKFAAFQKSLRDQTESVALIEIDNRDSQFISCAAALNAAMREVKTEYVIFSHQDIAFLDSETIKVFIDQLVNCCDHGILGVAGANKGIDHEKVYSNIIHGEGDNIVRAGKRIVDEFGKETSNPMECETVDECFFGGRTEYFVQHPFDEFVCDAWDLYAVEQCLRIRGEGGKVYVSGVQLWHKSQGRLTSRFYDSLYKLSKKYENDFDYISTTCTVIGTDPVFVKTYADLQMKIKQTDYLYCNNQELLNKAETLTRQNQEMQVKAERITNQNHGMETRLLELQDQNHGMETRLIESQNQNIRLDQHLTEMREQNSALDCQMADLRNQLIVAQNSLMETNKATLDMETRMLEAQNNVAALKERLTEEEEKKVALQEQLADFQEREQMQAIALSETQKQLQSSNLEMQAIQSQKADLERRLLDTHARLEHICGSDMYKLSLKYYRLRDFLFPENGKLRKFLKKLFNRFKKAEQIPALPANQIEAFLNYGKFKRMDVVTTPHTLYVAKLYQRCLKKIGVQCEIHVGEPDEYEDIPYIIICSQFIKRFPKVYLVVQMEQTVSSRWLTDQYFQSLQNSVAFMDYSLVNVEYYHRPENRDVSSRAYYVPVDYYPDYAAGSENDEKEYDVVFYGDANSCPRRRAILEELSKHFTVKICSEVFGEDVYKQIRKAKVLVNIHYYEGALLETTRLYETLSLNSCVIVSEASQDSQEDTRLKDIVDFVPTDDVEALVQRVAYWVEHDGARKEKIVTNKKLLTEKPSAFEFFFYRMLLAHDRLTFNEFYALAGDYVQLNTDKLCLSLPESTVRRKSFDQDNIYGFQCVPGLRHRKGWLGAGLSYKLIFTKAAEKNFESIMICEDDVIFPDQFEKKLDAIVSFLNSQKKWSVFSGVMADVGRIMLLAKKTQGDTTFIEIDHMISMVFNIYNREMFKLFQKWDERNQDVQMNAIDRYLQKEKLSVWTQVPFLVGHKEELDSTIWGFSNTTYKEMIANSEKKLLELAESEDFAK